MCKHKGCTEISNLSLVAEELQFLVALDQSDSSILSTVNANY